LAAWLPPAGGLPVLDLGAGTGLFATAIATWFDVRVVPDPPGPLRTAALDPFATAHSTSTRGY